MMTNWQLWYVLLLFKPSAGVTVIPRELRIKLTERNVWGICRLCRCANMTTLWFVKLCINAEILRLALSLLISAPRLRVYFLSLTLSVCASVRLSRTNFKSILLFCFSMESSHFLTPSTKRCSSIFDLGPLTPKIYSPKLFAMTLYYHVATPGRALGSSAPAWEKSAIHWTSGPTIVATATTFGSEI